MHLCDLSAIYQFLWRLLSSIAVDQIQGADLMKFLRSYIVGMLFLTGCDADPAPAPQVQANLAPIENNESFENFLERTHPTTTPNYTEEEDGTYHYVSAVSDEDREKGRALGSVVSYRYLGLRNGRHVLANVDDRGEAIWEHECSQPCRIIMTRVRGQVRRLPFDAESIIGSAFEDAINGHLTVTGRESRISDSSEAPIVAATPERIPSAFLGEWNSHLEHCGTELNDSRLRVEPRRLRFYESEAELLGITIHSASRVTVRGSFSGEGETWTDNVAMTLSPSGNELTIGGYTRYRCPS